MKVQCNREKIKEGFSIIQNVIPAKSTKPILQSVRLEAKEQSLELSATDLEIGVRFTLEEAKVGEPGVTVVPAKIAGDFVKDLTDETVSLETEGTSCHIRGLSDGCELVGENPDEFPRIPVFEEKDAVSISASILAEMVQKTSFAAAREMGRYAMHGIHVELNSETMKFVATDGRKLSLVERGIEKGPQKGVKIIIPTKGMQQFTRVTQSDQDQVDLHFSNHQVAMRTGSAEVYVRLLEGEFPDYSKVIPQDCPNFVEADRDKLLQKLQLVSNLTGDNSRAVQWSLQKESIILSARSAGRGEAKAELESVLKGDSMVVAFNPDYLIEGLKTADAETVKLEFIDKESPGKLSLGENHVYVVMPITIE